MRADQRAKWAEAVAKGQHEAPLHPAWITHCLEKVRGKDGILIKESPVTFEHMNFSQPGTMFSVGAAGALGWGLGTALGIKAAVGDELVIAPVGPTVAGTDLLVLDDAATKVGDLSADWVSSESLDRYRIAHGIPKMGAELTADTIPGEAGDWVSDASVSFTKGCYTGPELVARIDSRGNNVPHPIRLLVLDVDAAIGDEVLVDGATVGSLTSVAPALGAGLPALALARVGRAIVPGSVVAVQNGSAAAPASVVEPGAVR